MAVVFTLLPVILAGYRNHTTFYMRPSQPIAHRQYVARDRDLYCLRRYLKREKVFQSFPYQSRDTKTKQYGKLAVCSFMQKEVILRIDFVKMFKK